MASDEPRDISPPSKRRVPIIVPSHSQVEEQSRPRTPASLFRSSSTLTPPPHPSAFPAPQVTPPSSSQPPPPSAASGRSESFTEAFSFVKRTEFYSPPPAIPPPPAVPATGGGPASISTSTSGGLGPKQEVTVGQARNAIVVSKRQQGNPVLKHIRNVRWIFGDIVPDYLIGQYSCALYLSLRYHLLHPDYIYFRIRELQKSFRLRVVLCFVDVEDVVKPLHEVTKTALLHDCSLICAWSLEECARYLETIKIYENKPADDIQERLDHDYLSRLTSALTTIRHVNKTNVVTLGSTFGTLSAIMGASMEELSRCPGIGERKVKRIYDAFHEPFRRTSKQVRLSSVGITITSMKKASSQEDQPEQEGEIAGTPRMEVFEAPEVSVRKALDAAYAKYRPQLSERDENSNKITSVIAQFNEQGHSG